VKTDASIGMESGFYSFPVTHTESSRYKHVSSSVVSYLQYI